MKKSTFLRRASALCLKRTHKVRYACESKYICPAASSPTGLWQLLVFPAFGRLLDLESSMDSSEVTQFRRFKTTHTISDRACTCRIATQMFLSQEARAVASQSPSSGLGETHCGSKSLLVGRFMRRVVNGESLFTHQRPCKRLHTPNEI